MLAVQMLTSAERKRVGICSQLCLLMDVRRSSIEVFFRLNIENTTSNGGADQFSLVLILVARMWIL